MALALLAALGCFLGCGPKAPPADDATPEVAQKLMAEWPAVKPVIDALAKKDFQGAVEQYGKLAGEASTEKQQATVRRLGHYTLDAIGEHREKDPKAEEAYSVVRTMIMGR